MNRENDGLNFWLTFGLVMLISISASMIARELLLENTRDLLDRHFEKEKTAVWNFSSPSEKTTTNDEPNKFASKTRELRANSRTSIKNVKNNKEKQIEAAMGTLSPRTKTASCSGSILQPSYAKTKALSKTKRNIIPTNLASMDKNMDNLWKIR